MSRVVSQQALREFGASVNLIETLQPGPAVGAMPAATAWLAERQRIENSGHWVSPIGPRPRWRDRVFRTALEVFGLGMRLSGLYERGMSNALSPELTALELSFADLPRAFDGYRILFLSDTHLDSQPELAVRGRELLSGVAVDLIVVGGDLLASRRAPPAAALQPLVHMLEPVSASDGRFAVLGNHDTASIADALEHLGFEVLLNQSTTLSRGGEHITVTGLDDVHSFYTDAARAALCTPYEGFRIALVHSPEMADVGQHAGVSLYLCGHTHGGQICLPGGRGLVSCLVRCRHAARGLWCEGAMLGYTSRGLGTGRLPVRFNCPPELTLITLRRSG